MLKIAALCGVSALSILLVVTSVPFLYRLLAALGASMLLPLWVVIRIFVTIVVLGHHPIKENISENLEDI